MQLCAVIFQETDGRYAVVCPSVPGCVSRGRTRYEALKIHREAVALRFATRGVPTRCVDFHVVQGGAATAPVELQAG